MDILIENLDPEYAPSEGEHEGKIVRLRIFPNGRVDFINPYNEACIKTEAQATILPEHGDLIDRDVLANSIPEAEPDGFENCRECTCMTKDEIVEIILDAEVVLEANT